MNLRKSEIVPLKNYAGFGIMVGIYFKKQGDDANEKTFRNTGTGKKDH